MATSSVVLAGVLVLGAAKVADSDDVVTEFCPD
jgi:hypothetical protein